MVVVEEISEEVSINRKGKSLSLDHLNKFDSYPLPLNYLKEFVIVPFFIPWYKSKESNKVFPIMLQEIGDINPMRRNKLADLVIGYNPFFEHVKNKNYIIITKDEKPVGRVLAFIDENYNKENNTNTGWIGMFESVEEKDVANRLLHTAMIYLKSHGCKEMIGPAKFNANGEVGLLIDGFEHKPYFMEPYNPPYYEEFFISN